MALKTDQKITKDIPERFKPQEIETKWQKKWEEIGLNSPDITKAKKPYYNLMMFPYPSAEGLHVGNMYAFTGVDIHGRFMRLQGYDVFEPIGLDGFGIHSENYALKVNRHPKEQAKISEANYYRQLRAIGNMFDWTRTLETYDPDYYRWTQWLFVQMFKHGLAYRAQAEVNWCPSCKTVLADEQVIDGRCERCSAVVVKKDLEQWFFRITAYAERLLQNTYKPLFKWTEKVILGQRNWIGKKEGIVISYQLSADSIQGLNDSKIHIDCFTTRPDTNFGATFIVVSPEHPIVEKITSPEYLTVVKNYIKEAKSKSKDEHIVEGRQKTGVFTGVYAVNQLNNYRMPVYVADFVLMEVGTGAVVGVPGHDKRDFEFAQALKLPVIRVVVGKDGDRSPVTQIDKVQEKEGVMVNSGFLNGLPIQKAISKMMDHLEEKGWGKRVVSYHLRDWLISRQRYWGAPIPMIYCKKCASEGKSWFDMEESKKMQNAKWPMINNNSEIGHWSLVIGHSKEMVGWYPVSEDQLPVLLPDVKDWKPTGTGRGPLAGHPEFYETTCPHCGSPAERETDVCDTFLDSSWYYLRYPFASRHSDPPVGGEESPDQTVKLNSKGILTSSASRRTPQDDNLLPWDKEVLKRWTPIDSYIGGAEHTVLHLLYTRFTWMALRDWGYIDISRQPSAVRHKNEKNFDYIYDYDPDEPFKRFFAHGLIIKNGAKMSKSKGNVVVPDDYIKLYGADTLRTYLMFLGPFDQGGDFRDSGIAGMYRWLSRVWRLSQAQNSKLKTQNSAEGLKILHKTIKSVTHDMQELHYNTVIARLMEFTNWWMDHPEQIGTETVVVFLKMLAPFAPHMSEELFQFLKVKSEIEFNSIHMQPWPIFDEKMVQEDSVTMIVQINGKLRDSLEMTTQNAKQQQIVEQVAKKSAKIEKWLADEKIQKVVFVPGRLINFVV